MKQTSGQIGQEVLSTVPFLPEELLDMKSFLRNTNELPGAAPGPCRTAVDASSAYGCVDWYIYPDVKPESVAA
jgi:hypothetical protein